MRPLLLIVFSLLVFSAVGRTQEFAQPRSMGYFFVAPGFQYGGDAEQTLQFGSGGERRIFKGVGVGAEGGYIFATRNFPVSAIVGVISANGSYHFESPDRARKLDPFVTAGYSLGFSPEVAENWFNVGGGVHYWFREKLGLRLEFRDQVDPNHAETLHFVGFRIGLAFR